MRSLIVTALLSSMVLTTAQRTAANSLGCSQIASWPEYTNTWEHSGLTEQPDEVDEKSRRWLSTPQVNRTSGNSPLPLNALLNHLDENPNAKEFYQFVLPEILSGGQLVSPEVFAQRHRAFLKLKGIPDEHAVRPGTAFVSTENPSQFLFLELGQPPPKGYRPLRGVLDSEVWTLGLINGILPISWSGEIHKTFQLVTLFHEFGHLIGLSHLDYAIEIRKFSRFLMEENQQGRLKLNSYVMLDLEIQDLFEDLWVIRPQRRERLLTAVRILKETSTQLFTPGFKSRQAELRNKLGAIDLATPNDHDRRTELKKPIVNEIEVDLGEIRSQFEAAVKLWKQSRILLGGAVADGLTYESAAYSMGQGYSAIWKTEKHLRHMLERPELFRAGLDTLNIPILIDKFVETLTHESTNDIGGVFGRYYERIRRGNSTYLREEG